MVEEKKLAQVAPRRDEYEGYRDAVVEERVEANADQNALIPCIAGRYDVLEGRVARGRFIGLVVERMAPRSRLKSCILSR